jgi:hypothetical protein
MERIYGIEHHGGWVRDEQSKAERLRHRRAADERCERAGLLRQCRPVKAGRQGRRTACGPVRLEGRGWGRD